MSPTLRRAGLAGLAFAACLSVMPGQAQAPEVQLFRVVGPRDEVFIGVTPAELGRLGDGPAVERLARKLVADGQLTAWHYGVTRAPDGSTRFATSRRVAILRNDALRIEAYAAALPVAPPPAE
jgi:hypothetical protein